MKTRISTVVILAAGAALAATLEEGFRNPPDSAKPHTWYHMMNGNITKEGITCDFEALAKAGIGGVQMFDAGCNVPAGPLAFNTPEWFDLIRHAASEARRLGLEICLPTCSGWSSSGGPWIAPSNGMKKVVFSETQVKGPAAFKGRLPRETDDHGFYEDIAVLAFPTPPADLAEIPGVKIDLVGKTALLSSKDPFTVQGLSYRLDYPGLWGGAAMFKIEMSKDGETYRQIDKYVIPLAQSGVADRGLRYHQFARPVTARAFRLSFLTSQKVTVAEAWPERKLRISDAKGKSFDIRNYDVTVRRDSAKGAADQVVRADAILDLTDRLAPDGTLSWDVPPGDWTILRFGHVCNGRCNHPASAKGKGLEVDKLSASALDFHFNQYVARLCDHLGPLAGDVKSGLNNILVDSYEVGSQNWTQGFDKIFAERMGYSIRPWLPVLSGRVVESVDESERFLEDFRRTIADLFAENYSGRLAELCHKRGLKLSLEPYGNAPADNLQYGQDVDIPMGEFWSSAALGEHRTRTYNARFPAYLAHVWGRRVAATESFTAGPNDGGRWQTTPFAIKALGDRVYAEGVNRIIYHRFVHQPWPGDKYLPGMTMGRWGMHFDRTQTWWPLVGDWLRYQTRCQWMLQEGTFVADVLQYCGEGAPNQGGNTHENRNADSGIALPPGYAWDVCATKALHLLKVVDGRVVAPGGVSYALLALPGDDTMSEKTLKTVERLIDAGAKVCCPAKPVRSPGLAGYPAADGRVRALVDRIWAKGVMPCRAGEALEKLGIAPDFASTETDPETGAVYIHRREEGRGKREESRGEREESREKRGEGCDWYFVALNNADSKTFEASFRIAGKIPEIWDAEKGTIENAKQWRVENGRTFVTLDFPPSGSAFVVFRREGEEGIGKREEGKGKREEGKGKREEGKEKSETLLLPIAVPWRVSFPVEWYSGGDAVKTVVMTNLADWTSFDDPDIKYFSGSATYETTIPLASSIAYSSSLVLDLGDVKNFAVVTVNGKTFPVLWRPPYRVDITEAVDGRHPTSDNQPPAASHQLPTALDIEVKVTNLWPNRLIGDDTLYADDCEWKGSVVNGVKEIGVKKIPEWVKSGKTSPTGRHTFTTWRHWVKGEKLLPSGMTGPATLQAGVSPLSRRADEIAPWLPGKPAAAGARIGDRAAWDRLAALPSAAKRIKAAEEALATPVPELTDELYLEYSRNGNRTRYEKPFNARLTLLEDLLLGECLENKGRFLPGIIAYVKAIASERSWTYPAHDGSLKAFNGKPGIDLAVARTAAEFSFVYDWLRDVLPDDVKELIYSECDRRAFRPYLALCRTPGEDARRAICRWYERGYNWNAVCNSCVVCAALAMIDDSRLRAEFVASAERTVPRYLSGFSADGYCSEGAGYWNYGFRHHLYLGLAVRNATGGKVDLLSDPANRAAIEYAYGYRLMGWMPPRIADGVSSPSPTILALARQVCPEIGSRRTVNVDLLEGKLHTIAHRAFGQEPPPEYTESRDELPAHTWFFDAQVLISRGTWPSRDARMSIAIKGGHNDELHNHNDVGSYTVALDGAEMCGDPGAEIYTKRTFSKRRYESKMLNSYGHPVPVVGGRLQATGRKAAAKVLRTEFSDAKDVIVLDLTAAYPVPSLRSLVRTMTFDRGKATVAVSDAVEFSEPTDFEVPVVTYKRYRKNEDSSRFVFENKRGKQRGHDMTMEVESSAPVVFRDEKIENPGKPDVTRLAFAFDRPVTNAVFTVVYGVSSPRIGEIAKWLPEKPSADGARIGDRAAWDRLAALPSAAKRIKAAEVAMAKPIPELPDDLYLEYSRTGNRRNYEKPYMARWNMLEDMLLGECLENKGRFLPGIVACVKAIASERSWTLPAHDPDLTCFNGTPHIDLFSSARTLAFSLVYDWLGDVLPRDVKELIRSECDRRTFRPYLATCRTPDSSKIPHRHWWYEGGNNWNSVCSSCVVRSALAMIEDRYLRAEFIAAAEHSVPFAMNGYTPDGYCSEGMGYWNYGYGHHIMMGLAVRAATGGKVDFFSDPKNRAVMLYPYGYRLMDWSAPYFADGCGNPDPVLLALERQVFPDITGDCAGNLDLLAGDAPKIALRAFGQEPPESGAKGLDELPPHTWFPDAQVLLSRGSWADGATRMGIAIKGGHNAELHNHNDLGSYAIMMDGARMCGDPGGEVYTKRTFSKDRYESKMLNSYGHPVPVVGGKLQATGRKAAAKVLRTEFSDAKDVIVLDLTAAYPVPSLRSLVRTMTFDRGKATVAVSDAVEFSEPTAFEVPVVTYLDYGKNDDASRFVFRNPLGKQRGHDMTMEVKSSAPVVFRDEKIENPGRPDVTRLAFAFDRPVANAVFSVVYGVR